ncbi:MAG TPA: alkaline phosphatase D family protein, partial [Dongiaceae bacterium]|nr:alkaline phosphatase D family protein [Dongiaceae bacterium]
MPAAILTGPLLGLESDSLYTVCFTTTKNIAKASVIANGRAVPAVNVGETYGAHFWRADIQIAPQQSAQQVRYSVQLDGNPANNRNNSSEWQFYVPGKDEKPKILYASCNGFSSADLVNKTEHPYALWERLQQEHSAAPYSLMIMGGDQVYADEIWSLVPTLKEWSKLKRKEKAKRPQSKPLLQQIDRFYDDLYPQRWSNPVMADVLATVPNVMMWDDHDIFDGWGSYPEDLHNSPVFQAIFNTAKRYFELLQLRSRRNGSLLNRDGLHYAFAFQFRGYHILALDNRSERTLSQVMSRQQWDDVIAYLDKQAQQGDLLLLSAVPVVYRDFSFADTSLDVTPW